MSPERTRELSIFGFPISELAKIRPSPPNFLAFDQTRFRIGMHITTTSTMRNKTRTMNMRTAAVLVWTLIGRLVALSTGLVPLKVRRAGLLRMNAFRSEIVGVSGCYTLVSHRVTMIS